jgi:hypothetical protein
VNTRDGAKEVILRSNIQISNRGVLRLDVGVKRTNAVGVAEVEELKAIPAGDTVGIPFDLLTGGGVLLFRPADIPSYRYSSESLLLDSLSPGSMFLSCTSQDAASWVYACHISKITLGDGNVNWLISLMAPLQLENVLAEKVHYRLYDSAGQISTSGRLEKGQQSSIYQARPSRSLTPQAQVFAPCSFLLTVRFLF